MTIKELSQLHHLNIEIADYKDRLVELETAAMNITAGEITGMPHGFGVSDKVGNRTSEIADLKALIELSMQKCWYELNRLNRYVQTIDDSLMRQILSFRFINHLTWYQVAVSVGGGNTEESVRKLCYRFLKNSEEIINDVPNVRRGSAIL